MKFTAVGADTILYNGALVSDLPGGKIFEATFSDTIVEAKVGKNGNTIFVYKPMGRKAKAVIRVLRTGDADILLDTDLKAIESYFPAFRLITLTINKPVGDGNGNIKTESHVFSGGVIEKLIGVTTEVDGDTEQAVATYELTFAQDIRSIM